MQLTIKYATWVRRGIRGHGSGYNDLFCETDRVSTISTCQIPNSLPPNYHLVFVYETGNANVIFPDVLSNAQPYTAVSLDASQSQITITAVYRDISVPIGMGGSEPGILIDAFDKITGAFSNSPNFVTVAPDPDGSITRNANAEGFVPTSVAENIEALPSITDDHHAAFEEWHVISGTETVDPVNDLHASRNSSAIAFAFYSKVPVANLPGPLRFKIPLILHKAEEFIKDQVGIVEDVIKGEVKAIKHAIDISK